MRTPNRICLVLIILSILILIVSCSDATSPYWPNSSPQPSVPFSSPSSITSIPASSSPLSKSPSPSPVRPTMFKLSTNISPKQSGIIIPGTGQYVAGSKVNLKVNPKPGYIFYTWGGDAAGTASVLTITMDSDKNLFANLKEINPPSISFVTSEKILESSVSIIWRTDQLSTSQVEYGPDNSYGSITPVDYTLTCAHTVIIKGLIPQNTYHYRVSSINQTDSKSASDDSIFITKTILDLIKSSISDSETTDSHTQQISYTLNNGSSQVITVKKAELIDRMGQVQYTITPPEMMMLWKSTDLKPGDSFTGTIDLSTPRTTLELSNWTLYWYYQDAKANGFISIGNFKLTKK
jgi:uncharacterized repeat protein (TIGR02543 family)